MLWIADPEYERRTIRQILHSGVVDGVIVCAMLIDDPIVQALLEGDLPFVLVGRHPTDSRVNYVDVENQAGACAAAAHLIRIGRRRIASITGSLNAISGADRREGFLAAFRNQGLSPDLDLVVEGDFTEEGGYAAMRQLLPRQPDAVFVASDAMALGALRALREAGRRVPEDIAVIGFDDMPFAARADPPLATVRQPIHRLGAIAAETLIELIEHADAGPRRIVLPTEIVLRASCEVKNVSEPRQPVPS
jgi:LacI family transcriptional regulator